MCPFSRVGCCLLLLALPAALHAQSCDVSVSSGSWSVHPHPDSIWVNFTPDVASDDPQNPRLYDMLIRVSFNATPVDEHELTLRWAHGIGCPVDCPSVVCEEKEWTYKGVAIRDQSKCLQVGGDCVCPPLGDPVPHQKAIQKPQSSGLIEIEILPLNLQGCTPVNPDNDRTQFQYPGGGSPGMPGLSTVATVLLFGGLGALGFVRLRCRRSA